MNVNPWVVVILAVGIVLMVVGFKGTQDNLISALLGRPYQGAGGTPTNIPNNYQVTSYQQAPNTTQHITYT